MKTLTQKQPPGREEGPDKLADTALWVMAFPLDAANDTVLLNTHTHTYTCIFILYQITRLYACIGMCAYGNLSKHFHMTFAAFFLV